MDKARQGLVELISALNFDYHDVSLGMFRLYNYCLDNIKQENYDEVIVILKGLREAWSESMKNATDESKKELSLKT